MSESDAETIWMSRIDMNIPNTMMTNATTRFGSIRSETTGTSAAGLAVVAFAMWVQLGLPTSPIGRGEEDSRRARFFHETLRYLQSPIADESSSANRDRYPRRHPRRP